MTGLPAHMPQTAEAASAYIYKVKSPTLDDFKLMMFLESAGKGFYDALAEAAPNDAIKGLFARNGQEEMGHAHRVRRVIKKLYGEDVAVPETVGNPYCRSMPSIAITKEMMAGIVKGEIGGEALYEGWASNLKDEDAAKLLRQNGKEERKHGERVQEAMGLL